MKKEQIVSQDPSVMHGTLVFAGTRVPVESLIQHLVAGDSLDIFLDDFPTVSREQAVAYLEKTLEFTNARIEGLQNGVYSGNVRRGFLDDRDDITPNC